MERISRYCSSVIALSGVFFLSLVWALQVSSSIPLYGDTPEYLRLAQSLHVDQYRTVLYPFLLRTLGVITNGLTSPSIAWIYLLQWLMTGVSVGVFAFAILQSIPLIPASQERFLITALVTSFVITTPLVAHFSSTLLSDSLASSFLHSFPGQRRLVA